MITHTWTIENLECSPELNGFENVVRKIHWALNSSNGYKITSTNGSTELEFNPNYSTFVNYNFLDQQTVLGWLFNELTTELVANYQKTHENILNAPPVPEIVEIPLPWAQE